MPQKKLSILQKTGLIILVSCLLITTLWGFWGWFVTKTSREQLTTFLADHFNEDQFNLIDIELLRYKPHLTGAKALLKANSKIPFVQQQMGNQFFIIELINGPVFTDKGKQRFGKALWKLSLSSAQKNPIDHLFSTQHPFLTLRVGFDNSLNYQLDIKRWSSPAIQIDHLIAQGAISPDTLKHNLNIDVHRLRVKADTRLVEVPALKLDIKIDQQRTLKQQQIHYTSNPFVIFLTDNTKTEHKTHLELASKGQFFSINNALSGEVSLDFESVLAHTIPSHLTLNLKNLSLKGYQLLLKTQATIFNLKQQIQWTLEENAETPEGQDHIWQLYDQAEKKQQQIGHILSKDILSLEDSSLQIELALEDKQILPPAFNKKLSDLSQQGIINQLNNHYHLMINSANKKLNINNTAMTWETFLSNVPFKGTK